MGKESGTTRWWEYYLPRYLMPSVAGAIIVNWLCSYGGNGLRSLLSLPANGATLDSSSLILLFLYGNLFCYIASYPVLVFHATRVMDFSRGRWPAHPLIDGYLLTVALVLGTFAIHFVPADYRYWLAFSVALIILAVQLLRLWIVSSHPFKPKGHGDVVSQAYSYSYVLTHRRGLPEVKETREKAGIGGTKRRPTTCKQRKRKKRKKSKLLRAVQTHGAESLWIPIGICESTVTQRSSFCLRLC